MKCLRILRLPVLITALLGICSICPGITIYSSDDYGFIETLMEVSSDSKVEVNGDAVSGSAPIDITFYAFPPDGAIYFLWEIATDDTFSNVVLRYNETSFNHVFNEYGTFYTRFYCADEGGITEGWSTIYKIEVFESQLWCPNAFTPYGSPGVNDEWKVTASSIVSFDCIIFDRWGKEMAHLTSVNDSWDGYYKGKLVPPGVYFYVIKAKGAEGRQYNLSGNINLIGKNRNRK